MSNIERCVTTNVLSRRLLLSGGATAIAAGALMPEGAYASGTAAIDPAPDENAALYRLAIGDIRATIISDGTIAGNVRIYARNAGQEELDQVLAATSYVPERFELQLNTLLIETGGRKYLVDPGANLTMGPNGGKLPARLAAMGIRPEDIDAIVISHTHPDHVGNLRREDGTPTFPNAEIYIPEPDWNFFIANEPDLTHLPMQPEFRERFIRNIKTNVEAVRSNVVRYRPGSEVVPGIMSMPAHGHTLGLCVFLISSGNQQLMVTADLVYHPLLNIDHGWLPGVDTDQEAAIETRKKLFDRIATDRLVILGFHFPFPGLGRLMKTAWGYRWMPELWKFSA
ncbi:hydrolase [Brucella endophytica]|uniref:Hydrolase n=1 Tax=Brucella endophytica TaxID=1963359 RepID=A0A916WD34_9HYPH|nr:MBL fold metallo-hydrolase [Brucella endophytica]GGA87757.1 hydrolase [Brucella endophytica]